MRHPSMAAAAMVVSLAASPALAQMDSREAIALQNQILELRRELQQSQGGGRAYAPPVAATPGSGDLNAQLLERVTQLEDSVRQLRGRLDEADNARQRQLDALDKRVGDLEFRAGGGSAAPALRPPAGVLSPPSGTVPLPVAPAPPGAVRRTPELALQDGNASLARHDYDAAEADAREVLANGKGPRGTDAQYLLAQSLAGKRDYQGAAVAFDDAYSRNPRGSRAPDSLVGLANSLTAINARKAACETLDKLRAEFPGMRSDLRPIAAAARQRAGCG